MKQLLLLFVVLTGLSKAQTCGNLNVETGNLAGWILTNGQNTNPTTMAGCCSSPGSTEVVVKTTPVSDGYAIVMPHSPFGGTKVIKVGDSIPGTVWASRATYSFVVTGNTLQYAIAPFAYAPQSHPCNGTCFSAVRLLDQTSTPFYTDIMIPAGSSGTCSPGSAAFTNSTSGTAWGCWKTYAINIGAYFGQTITVEVSSADCTGLGHFGYCYFDAICTAATPTMISCGLTTGINETTVNSTEVSVFPNPAKDNLHINLNSDNAEVFIYDLVGKLVLHKKELQNENSIYIKNLNQGLYFYNVVQNNKSIKTGKIIKE